MTESITFTITPSEPFGIFANPRVSADALHARLVEQGRLSLLEGEADKALRGSPTLDDSLDRAARLIYLLIEQHSNHGIHDAGFAVAWAVAFIEDARRPTPADVAVFVDRLVWGWAVVDHDEGVEALLSTTDAAAKYLAETDERDNLADVVPMMFFDGEDEYPGIVLTEDELAALGPCPGLRTAEKVMSRRRVLEQMRELERMREAPRGEADWRRSAIAWLRQQEAGIQGDPELGPTPADTYSIRMLIGLLEAEAKDGAA